MDLRNELQTLRDRVEAECLACAKRGDQDSADALEAIGLRITGVIEKSRIDLGTLDARRPLFPYPEAAGGGGSWAHSTSHDARILQVIENANDPPKPVRDWPETE